MDSMLSEDPTDARHENTLCPVCEAPAGRHVVGLSTGLRYCSHAHARQHAESGEMLRCNACGELVEGGE